MARRLRIRYPGAIYYVINRGNYRRDLFESSGAAQAFVTVLEEAVARYAWRLHAYVVMRNHYHLAVETPEPTLVEGMHWLQSTLATRFNRCRQEHGHLFQGRYQSILVEDSTALARLVDYIHLNPVRARLIAPEQVALFRWSSLSRFTKGPRFPGLEAGAWLPIHGPWPDSVQGWSSYREHLVRLGADEAAQRELGFDQITKGWAIGTAAWRRAMAEDHASLALDPGFAAEEIRELRHAHWQRQLDFWRKELGRCRNEAANERRSAPWKLALALRLRKEAGASVTWIVQTLHMGKPTSLRGYLANANRQSARPLL